MNLGLKEFMSNKFMSEELTKIIGVFTASVVMAFCISLMMAIVVMSAMWIEVKYYHGYLGAPYKECEK